MLEAIINFVHDYSDRLCEQPCVPLEPVRKLETERSPTGTHDKCRSSTLFDGAQSGRQFREGKRCGSNTINLYITRVAYSYSLLIAF